MYFNRSLVNVYLVVLSISLIFAAKTGGAVGSAGEVISMQTDAEFQDECHCKAADLCPPENRVKTSTVCPFSSQICCKSDNTANLNPSRQPVEPVETTENSNSNLQTVYPIMGEEENSTPNSQTVVTPVETEIPNSYQNIQTVNPMEDNPEKCGMRNIADRSKPFSNDESSTVTGKFPWMVFILEMQFAPDGSLTDELLCGGSLINSKIVLTAARCVFQYYKQLTPNKNTIKVRAGEYETLPGVNETIPYQDRFVDVISIPDNFNNTTLHNDVALIRVKGKFNYTTYVFPICVPFLQSLYAISTRNIYDPTNCIETGWGKRSQSDSSYQYSSIFGKEECQSELQKTKLGKTFELHSSFICAKGLNGGGDTCEGAVGIGGTLVCALREYPDQYVQVGVVSWGTQCEKTPGIYASLEANQKWLTSEFHNLRLL